MSASGTASWCHRSSDATPAGIATTSLYSCCDTTNVHVSAIEKANRQETRQSRESQ
jgi:hypothetical protein